MFEKYSSNPEFYKKHQDNTLQFQTYNSRFQSIKQNYIGSYEIYQEKKAQSTNEAEIEKWRSKLEQNWLELTEFLAKDWDYDVEIFRELCGIKKVDLFNAATKVSTYSQADLYGQSIDFFELYASKSQNKSKNEQKSLLQRLLDYFY